MLTWQRCTSSPSDEPESWAAREREARSSASFSASCAAIGRRCCSGAGSRLLQKASSSSCIAVGRSCAGGPRHLPCARELKSGLSGAGPPVLLQFGQSCVAEGICCSYFAVSLAVLADPDICPKNTT